MKLQNIEYYQDSVSVIIEKMISAISGVKPFRLKVFTSSLIYTRLVQFLVREGVKNKNLGGIFPGGGGYPLSV